MDIVATLKRMEHEQKLSNKTLFRKLMSQIVERDVKYVNL
jgi:hypothetical protein